VSDAPSGVCAVVIGSGSAGLTVAIGLAGLGHRVVVIERGPIGGDCTNVGCIPSKTLIHLARAGVASPWDQVRATRDGLEAEESEMLAGTPGVELLRGEARLAGAGRVEVACVDGTTRTVHGDHVVVASGSAPITIDLPGIDPERLFTNEDVFELSETPAHVVIVGAGAIAVELAFALRRLGAQVTVVEGAERVLPREDPEVSTAIFGALERAGVAVHLGSAASGFDEGSRTLSLQSGASVAAVDRVLLAVGRRPRTNGLGLEALGLDVAGGVTTDGWGRTSVAGVWAVGDVTGQTTTTHGANAMARRVVQAIGLPKVPRVGRPPTIPSVVFAEPEVASVGLTLREVERRWPASARMTLRVDLTDTDRGLTDGITEGFVQVHVARFTGRILRASIVGPAAGEAIGIFTLAIDRRISMHRLYRLVHPYPTFASAIGRVADEFTRQTLPSLGSEATAWVRSLPHRWKKEP
jgi:pyruvate/2-oxoglutarate dehydrogenase complex dihydrolipoamide dehydrogenase (E3) component